MVALECIFRNKTALNARHCTRIILYNITEKWQLKCMVFFFLSFFLSFLPASQIIICVLEERK